MATAFGRSSRKEHRARHPRNWRDTASRAVRITAIALAVLVIITLGADSGGNPASQLSALLCTAAFIMSLTYLLVISHEVHISFFDLDELIKERSESQTDEDATQSGTKRNDLLKGTKDLLARGTRKDAHPDEVITLLEESLKGRSKTYNRAVMAAVLKELPVFFNSHTEVMNYVLHSLKNCSAEWEKRGAVEMFRRMLEGAEQE